MGEREWDTGWPITQARGSGVAIARVLQRRERSRLEDPALLVLMRTELAAPLQVVLKRGVRHQGVALALALSLALVLPDVHDLIQRADLGGRIKHRLAAVLHLGRMAVLFVELQPLRELAVLQGVNAQIEDHGVWAILHRSRLTKDATAWLQVQVGVPGTRS